jgi:hypothetical protein
MLNGTVKGFCIILVYYIQIAVFSIKYYEKYDSFRYYFDSPLTGYFVLFCSFHCVPFYFVSFRSEAFVLFVEL